MAGFLSSVNLIAGAGLLGNIGGVALTANTQVVASIAGYDGQPVVVQFANVKTTGNSVLLSNTMTALQNLASNTFPVVTNAIPVAYNPTLGNTPLTGLSGAVTTQINNIMGNGDLGKFDQIFGSALGYTISTNQLINTLVNASDASYDATFYNQDNIITGSLSQITQAFGAFADELLALGTVIDFANLADLGSPQALLRQIFAQSQGSFEFNTALTSAGINQNLIDNINTVQLTDEQQAIVYQVMTKTTGNTLIQILALLRVDTPGIVTLADLLNPVKMFPTTFITLTAPTVNGVKGIYVNSQGSVNTTLETELPASVLFRLQGYQIVNNTYEQLRRIIPADQALANKALQAGLQQVKAIFNVDQTGLAVAMRRLESNKGLDLINALTEPIPQSIIDFYKQTYTEGSGPNGTLLLTDVIGSAAGWNITANLNATTTTLSSLYSGGALTTLTNGTTGVFTVMQNAVDGIYTDGFGNVTIPGGLPGAGFYNDLDEAFTQGLIPAAQSLIGNIVVANPAPVSVANSDWSNVTNQLSVETVNLGRAGVNFADLAAGVVPNGLVTGLSSYGLDTVEGGAAWYLESLANLSNLGGQAIVSTMRESRNQTRLQRVGLETDIIVSDTVPQPQAQLSSGQYTVSEAVSQKSI